MIEGLSPEEVRGKIYSGWQIVDSIPQGASLIKFGLDWGWYPDPVAAISLWYYNGSYIVDEVIYGTNIEDQILADAIKKVSGWQNVSTICGADEPKSIETLRKFKIRAEATDNRKGSVDYRIKTTSSKKIMVTRRSTNVWQGYENYAWAEDKDGNPRGVPNHAFSDTMDAVSYAVASINPMRDYINPPVTGPIKIRTNVAL